MSLGFDMAVGPDGYAWWYLDALSDDGRHGLTLIAFVGSVFSPYYAWARRRGPADPANHCAVNLALYATGAKRTAPQRWTMTERGRSALARSADTLSIGPSGLHWDGTHLTVDLAETAVPLPRPVRGRIRVHPAALTAGPYRIDAAGRHRWWPIAPRARVELELGDPALRWSGDGYLDHNAGDAPLERDFVEWDWSRAAFGAGAAVLYDTVRRDGTTGAMALAFDSAGAARALEPPPQVALPRTGWRVRRLTRADAGHRAAVAQTLEDTPFYARSLVTTHLAGQPVQAVHESLALDRFANPIVQAMLPFRMPRRRG
jgi:carotenoid 1,2-hydratase